MRGWVCASLPRSIMHGSHPHHIRPLITSHRTAVGLSHHSAEQSIFGCASLKSSTNGSGSSKTRMASAEPLGNLKTHACYRHPGEYPVRLLAVFHPGRPFWMFSQSKCKSRRSWKRGHSSQGGEQRGPCGWRPSCTWYPGCRLEAPGHLLGAKLTNLSGRHCAHTAPAYAFPSSISLPPQVAYARPGLENRPR